MSSKNVKQSSLVSIVLPVFNSKTFHHGLESILNQTYTQLEIIVINDGSEIPISRSNADPRIKWIRHDHQGLSYTLNQGIHHASGTYIARMDADDVSDINRIAHQVLYLETHHEIDIVATQVEELSHVSEGLKYYIHWQNLLISSEDIYLNRFVDAPLVHPTVMMRATSIVKYGTYYNNVPEDFELWLRWMDAGARFAKVPAPLLNWNDHPHRLTRTHPNYDRDKFFQIKAKYFMSWLKRTIKSSTPLWICGTGSKVYNRVKFLREQGLKIGGYIDVKPTRSNRTIISYEELDPDKHPMILSYVSDRIGSKRIHKFLKNKGFVEGVNFYMMA